MKRGQLLVLLSLSILFFFNSNASAQECPAPENLSITIDTSTPPIAHVSWTVPPGSNVVGFIFTYSIDGGTPISITLPLAPTSYDVVLPKNWARLEVELVSVCEGGGVSDVSREIVSNIIIEDLVLFKPGGAEEIICTNPCPGSTYFYYSQGSGLNGLGIGAGGDPSNNDGGAGSEDPIGPDGAGSLEVFKDATFCLCMENKGNDYQNQEIVNACRLSAREFMPFSPYITFCRAPGTRSLEQSQDKGSVMWHPNPASTDLWIQSRSQPVWCVITDLTGKPMMAAFIVQSSTSIQVSDWKPGVYFIQTTDQSGRVNMGKFVKI